MYIAFVARITGAPADPEPDEKNSSCPAFCAGKKYCHFFLPGTWFGTRMTDTRDPDLLSGLRLTVYYVGQQKIHIMCLIKTHKEPRIAQNDIEVWKVLTPKGLSPFQGYQYHPGMNKPACAKTGPVPAEQQEINGGYLHAFRSKEKAEGYTQLQSYQKIVKLYGGRPVVQCIFEEYVVRRMVIPKGSVYYEGMDDDICAERLYWPEEGTAHPNPAEFKQV